MKKKIIKSLIIKAFNFYGLDVTCNKVVSARNFTRLTGEIEKGKRLSDKQIHRIEKYLSDNTGETVCLNVKKEKFSIVVPKADFKPLTLEDALTRADISRMDLPIILGENGDGSVLAVDLKKIGSLLVVGNDENGKRNMLASIKRTLLQDNGNVEVCLFTVSLTSGDVYCNDRKFQEIASGWFKDNTLDGFMEFYTWLAESEIRRRWNIMEDYDAFDTMEYEAFTGKKLPCFVFVLGGIEKIAEAEQLKIFKRITRNACIFSGISVGIHAIVFQKANNNYGDLFPVDILAKQLPVRIGFKSSEAVGRRLFKTKETAYLKYPGEAIFYNSKNKRRFRLQMPTLPHQE